MYAANYLFRWGGTRWAVDPLTISARTSAASPTSPTNDFARCDFIVLTHRHADHLDSNLLKAISGLDIPWVIPEFLLEEVLENLPLPARRIIVPEAGKALVISGIKVLPL